MLVDNENKDKEIVIKKGDVWKLDEDYPYIDISYTKVEIYDYRKGRKTVTVLTTNEDGETCYNFGSGRKTMKVESLIKRLKNYENICKK